MKCWCGEHTFYPAYEGPIRDGKPGSSVDGVIYFCSECGTLRLEDKHFKTAEYYLSGEYERTVKQPSNLSEYLMHAEAINSIIPLRDKAVGDIGTGRGELLDVLAAAKPRALYGWEVGDTFTPDCLDIATCINVIEHVEDPLALMLSAKETIKPGGYLVVGTPNCDNIMMGMSKFRAFFYRTQHNWYFDRESLCRLFNEAGFDYVKIASREKYGFSNFLDFACDEQSTIREGAGIAFDSAWKGFLAQTGQGNMLYVIGQK